MNIMATIEERLSRLASFAELRADAPELPAKVLELSDRSIVDILRGLGAVANDVGRLQALVAGVAAHRSQRKHGQGGLAAGEGHASPASLIQDITGGSKADARRQVRVGTALLEGAIDQLESAGVGSDDGGGESEPDAGGEVPATTRPTFADVLREAHLAGRLTSEQHDVIRRGLGAPFDDSGDAAEVWAVAAARLVDDAARLTLEDLDVHARALRDALDPTGAEERFARRFENRSFRMWIDRDGQRRGSVVFDDEGGLWWQSIVAAGLRPRRGGPRFFTDDERAQAAQLQADPRSNDQLAYDLFLAVMQAGAVADAKDVFGVRQPGVRVIVVQDPAAADGREAPGAEAIGPEGSGRDTSDAETPDAETSDAETSDAETSGPETSDPETSDPETPETIGPATVTATTPSAMRRPVIGPRDAFGRLRAVGFAEDGGQALPGSVVDRTICSHGTTEVTVDGRGNPLDVGREQRLFGAKQRLALVARDGGCMWPTCSMPASFCEAHHIDPYAEGGATDVGRGILLCRYHHLLLHNRGWRITRDGLAAFILHAPPDSAEPPIVLASKAPWKWAWDPPPPPDRRGWRAA